MDNNSTETNHQIIQNDERITVLVTSKTNIDFSPVASKPLGDNEREYANDHTSSMETERVETKVSEQTTVTSEKSDDSTFPKSILSDSEKMKSLMRKKSVSFENDEDVKKFISGEEILDQKNPFRFSIDDDDYTEKYRIVKVKKSNGSTKVPVNDTSAIKAVDETDFISKEEILKQSKYVPVYIKHPDRVLLPPSNYVELIKPPISAKPVMVKRAPVPIPRKSIKVPTKEKRKSRSANGHAKYPDLSDIKVSSDIVTCEYR